MGLQEGKDADIHLTGYNLSSKVAVKGEPSPEDPREVIFRPDTAKGAAFNRVRLALGSEPEMPASGSNTELAKAQLLNGPVTVNGKLEAAENYYRFHAHKSRKIDFRSERQPAGLAARFVARDPR